MPFIFQKSNIIDDVILVTPKYFKDSRGFFMETFKFDDFRKNGIDEIFLQDNQSYSTENVIRGIHFQKNPKPQGKLVRCTKGIILDVAVDLRPDSKTFKKWISYELSEENKNMLWIPAGFGHGFSVLSKEAEICYKCTNEYNANLDSGVRYDDPDLNIDWKIKSPVISDKDSQLPYLKDLII
jgi:dTDP-4-dehydrorhamnose 3,5-epimerase